MISPCVQILRDITSSLNNLLAYYQGKTHSPPNLTADIYTLMDSLAENEVYVIKKGCTLDYDDAETKDSITLGMDSLKTALDDYNMAFQVRQTRAQQPPVTGETLPILASSSLAPEDPAHAEVPGGTTMDVHTDSNSAEASDGNSDESSSDSRSEASKWAEGDIDERDVEDDEAFTVSVSKDVALDSDMETDEEDDSETESDDPEGDID
jgi:hypothetical protein